MLDFKYIVLLLLFKLASFNITDVSLYIYYYHSRVDYVINVVDVGLYNNYHVTRNGTYILFMTTLHIKLQISKNANVGGVKCPGGGVVK